MPCIQEVLPPFPPLWSVCNGVWRRSCRIGYPRYPFLLSLATLHFPQRQRTSSTVYRPLGAKYLTLRSRHSLGIGTIKMLPHPHYRSAKRAGQPTQPRGPQARVPSGCWKLLAPLRSLHWGINPNGNVTIFLYQIVIHL